MTCGIYLIKNKLTNQMYVGQSVNIENRFRQHITPSNIRQYIDKSIKKYGMRNFFFKILFECKEEELDNEEIKIIRLYNTYLDKNHYNLTPGGMGFRNGRTPKYHVTKAGIKFNKQRYLLFSPDNRYIKCSVDVNYLEDLAYQLNNGIITETYFLKNYRIIKNGIQDGVQLYVLKSNDKKLIYSRDKRKLENLRTKLINNEICEEDIWNKTYKIVKNGFSSNRQRYSIVNPNGRVIKSSVHREKLEVLLNQLTNERDLNEDSCDDFEAE